MPIIPRQDISSIPIPTAPQAPSIPLPDINAYPGAQGAKIGAAIAQTGNAVSETGATYLAVQARVQASALKAEAAVRAEKALEDVKAKPQQTIEGVKLESGDPGGLDEPTVTTSMVPRSQTFLPDFQKALKDINDDITARAKGLGNPLIGQYLAPNLNYINKASTIQAQKLQVGFLQQEERAMMIENADLLTKQLGSTLAPPPAIDENGGASISLANDRSYETLRNGVAEIFDQAQAVGGEHADIAQKLKVAKLAKIDHGRATQVMTSNPAAWLEASTSGKNEWEQRLTPESFKRLNDNAHSIVTKAEGSANQRRLELQRTTEAGYLENTQPESTAPLTRAQIVQDVKDKKLDYEHAKPWLDIVDNLSNGHWRSDGPTRVRVMLAAQSPDVDYRQFEAATRPLVRPGGLSTDDYKEALGHAKAISDKRNDRADQLGFHTLATVHTDMTTQLKTPPTLLGKAFDDTSDAIRGRASNELAEVALRSGFNPEAIAKWKKDRLPDYARQIVGNSKDTVKVLSNALPVAPPMVDPKTGFIEQDELDKAAKRIFSLYKVDPKQYGALKKQGRIPAEMDRALKSLDDIESLNQYQRDNASRESNR